MLQISQWSCVCYLLILSAIDIYKRKLPVWLLVVGATMAVVYQLLCQERSFVLSLAGAAVGGIFLIVSKITKEAFGYGDSILILILGVYLGIWYLFCVLAGAFLLSAGFAAAVLTLRRFQRKAAFPFVPFLTAGYIVILLVGGF